MLSSSHAIKRPLLSALCSARHPAERRHDAAPLRLSGRRRGLDRARRLSHIATAISAAPAWIISTMCGSSGTGPGGLSRTGVRQTGRRLALLTTRGAMPYTEFAFRARRHPAWSGANRPAFRKRSIGAAQARLLIPVRAGLRSLNVAVAAAMVFGRGSAADNRIQRGRQMADRNCRHRSLTAANRRRRHGSNPCNRGSSPPSRRWSDARTPSCCARARSRAFSRLPLGSGPTTTARPAAAAAWVCSRGGCSKRRASIARRCTEPSRRNSPKTCPARRKTRVSGLRASR